VDKAGFGAVLEQEGEDKLRHPKAYASMMGKRSMPPLSWKWQH